MSDLFTRAWVRVSNARYMWREEGQATTEYVMVVALIVGIVALVLGLTATGAISTGSFFDKLKTKLGNLTP